MTQPKFNDWWKLQLPTSTITKTCRFTVMTRILIVAARLLLPRHWYQLAHRLNRDYMCIMEDTDKLLYEDFARAPIAHVTYLLRMPDALQGTNDAKLEQFSRIPSLAPVLNDMKSRRYFSMRQYTPAFQYLMHSDSWIPLPEMFSTGGSLSEDIFKASKTPGHHVLDADSRPLTIDLPLAHSFDLSEQLSVHHQLSNAISDWELALLDLDSEKTTTHPETVQTLCPLYSDAPARKPRRLPAGLAKRDQAQDADVPEQAWPALGDARSRDV